MLGATGGTGQEVVAQAVEQGYEVTALVRSPARLLTRSERLRVLTGDVTAEGPELAQAVRGQDAVISALGRGTSFKPDGMIAQSAPRIMRAMETAGVRRLIFTSAFGVGETYRDLPFLPRQMIRFLLGGIYADKEAGEEAIRRSGLDWTVVYPSALTNGPGTGRYRHGERLELRGLPRISRADLAEFLVRQIADTSYLRKGVLVSS